MVVGILGGTFDPPHAGHLGVARGALESGLVDEVWLIPCVAHRFDKEPAAFEHRLAMCRLLAREEPGISVSDIEKTLARPGYTLDLVMALKEAHPEMSFRLLAGTDIYHQRTEWHRYDEIARQAPPIYVERLGVDPIPEPTLPAPPKVSSHDMRAALARGERPEGSIPGSVLDYIESHGLYRSAT